jgi:hypothetical integral membrane protein (TIGR02206 family)
MDLSTEHLLAVVAIAICAAVLVTMARLRPGEWTRAAAFALAVLLVGAEVGWWIYLDVTGAKDAELGTALPLQLCDAAIFISAFALVLRTQLLVELTYFWGLAGTIQALITPDLPQHFPAFPYFQYYVAHGGIVTAALFLVVGLGQWPHRDALLRVLVVTVAYALLVGAIDAATGANYMYLRSKPPASLLDLLGGWPWYIAWASVVGVALLFVLDAPFRWLRYRSTLDVDAHQAGP